MDEPGEQINQTPMVIGYAEASTTPRMTFREKLARRWFFICLKAFSLLVLMCIGGTLGSQFIDFSRSLPYEESVSVAVSSGSQRASSLSDLQHCHDLLLPNSIGQFLHENLPEQPISPEDLSKRIKVSPVKKDGTFCVTVEGVDHSDCGDLTLGCGHALYYYFQSHRLQLVFIYNQSRSAPVSQYAPMINTLVGMTTGFITGLIIIKVSARRFRNAD